MTTEIEVRPARMSAEEYFAADGLSHSGMKDLAVSPLRYWYLNLSRDSPKDEGSQAMDLGSALHCAVLEPNEFDSRYACELVPPEDALDTISDINQWIVDHGGAACKKGTLKAEVIKFAFECGVAQPVILDVLKAQHAEAHAGKKLFKLDDWQRIAGMAYALTNEPRILSILKEGEPEVALFTVDLETGVTLKGRLDWVTPTVTLDIKTFTQKRGKSIDQSVADAIYYEGYHAQAYRYAMLRGWPKWDGKHVVAFVESDPPHEVRLRSLGPKSDGQANLYWTTAQMQTRQLIRLYKKCMDHFGKDQPWRYAQEIDPLLDEEMKGLVFG